MEDIALTNILLIFCLSTLLLYVISYVVYQRYFSPLSKYPGPFFASITNLWKFYQYGTLKMPQNFIKLHEKYGPVVRIGPNDLDFNGADAVSQIYKSGRRMPKSQFYEAFTAIRPNVFGSRDENFHGLRRRQMAHGFSVTSLKSMEPIFDDHIDYLRAKLDRHARSGEALDLKETFSYYGYDVTGQLAFNRQFNTQVMDDPSKLPPLHGHFLLGNMYGAVANLLPHFRTLTSLHPYVRRMIKSRTELARAARESVANAISTHKRDEKIRTLMTSLIDAQDPETGAKLDIEEINSEAFGFLVAGSHTTGSSLVVFFYELLHNPHTLHALVNELDSQLAHQTQNYTFAGLESKLPYTLACIRESFRMMPVAGGMMPREVIEDQGAEIDGHLVPKGTNCSMIPLTLHHNPAVWGPDHDSFVPERFLQASPLFKPSGANLLLHFGHGPRQCIGRNIAMVSMFKIVVTLLKLYSFELVDQNDQLDMLFYGVGDKKGRLLVKVKQR